MTSLLTASEIRIRIPPAQTATTRESKERLLTNGPLDEAIRGRSRAQEALRRKGHKSPPMSPLSSIYEVPAQSDQSPQVGSASSIQDPAPLPGDEKYWESFQVEIGKLGDVEDRRAWSLKNSKVACSHCKAADVECVSGEGVRCQTCTVGRITCSKAADYHRQRIRDRLGITDPALYDRLFIQWKQLQAAKESQGREKTDASPAAQRKDVPRARRGKWPKKGSSRRSTRGLVHELEAGGLSDHDDGGEGPNGDLNGALPAGSSSSPPVLGEPPTPQSDPFVEPVHTSVHREVPAVMVPTHPTETATINPSPSIQKPPSPIRVNKQVQVRQKERNHDLRRYEGYLAERERSNLTATLVRIYEYETILDDLSEAWNRNDANRANKCFMTFRKSIKSWRRDTMDGLGELGLPEYQPFESAGSVKKRRREEYESEFEGSDIEDDELQERADGRKGGADDEDEGYFSRAKGKRRRI